MKVNMRLLPVKAHWFFFMAASGPILPFLTVYGKQLGISEVVMGSITAVLPFGFLLAKPFFGFLLDYFHRQRKLLFMSLVCAMSAFYVLLYFVPPPPGALVLVPANLQSNGTEGWMHGHSPCDCTGVNRTVSDSSSNSSDSNSTDGGMGTGTLYSSATFYSFVVLMCLAMVAYNVANSVSDAICFDMLGPGQEGAYGGQRVWGAVGFGLTALLGGLGMDLWSDGGEKNYAPACVMVLIFTFFDMVFCTRLQLPKMGQSQHILKDVRWVLQKKRVVIFLGFTALAGILESFIIYFMFWFLEDLSESQGQMGSIKILEGLVVAAETLGGELIFFPLSGRILARLGHGHTFTLCFLAYALRLGLISLIPSPWWLLPIEFCMQGPTFALCYTTIVAYASAVSPPGTSATMQGLVAGVDDGLGFALGSLIGGFLYRAAGGRLSFQLFSGAALICCVCHALLFRFYLSHKEDPVSGAENGIEYKPPLEALRSVTSPVDTS